jgi:UDP-2,3-diacylglucosamine hydrolase
MKLCIIAGSGGLPVYVAKENKDAFVLCIKEHSHTSLFKNKSYSVSLLDPDNWIKILKLNNISHIVMAGKVNRPEVMNEKMSKTGEELIKNISALGDDSALNLIESFFHNHGFEILPLYSFLKDCFLPKGFHPQKKILLSLQEYILETAGVGIDLLNTISRFDIGQSVVICSKLVYAVEAQEGTDVMIDRAGLLIKKNIMYRNFGPVLIKIPKMNQNVNMDLPVVGFDTVKRCIKYGFSSLVISSNGTLIFELKKIMNLIKKTEFCIYVV